MARPLPSLVTQKMPFLPLPVATLFVLIGVFSVFSMVTFLCASHKALKPSKKERTVHLVDKKVISRLQSNISSKALLMVKMMSWKKVRDEEEEELEGFDGEEAVWRRTIIMGEKCRPLEFSGKILYDVNGNLLPNSPRKGGTHKVVSLEKS
ncbi:WD repeat-containing protein [Actinidia chinensis var. chinensis]|uniref:WD repeat-containing protein n=1 Tax=Actinidia chinensis var. chinensis TaxID=1590841 RepID=A0A2R6PA19_ACTCC|nr:WD repeat-containing protein [Actinidia chinensis var. chinensis]